MNAGYRLYATEGTATTIAALGLDVTTVTKVLSGAHPNVVDVINDGTVQCVINTPEGRLTGIACGTASTSAGRRPRSVSPASRRIDTARAAIEALTNAANYEVATLAEYVSR